jgi:hypothetical protein
MCTCAGGSQLQQEQHQMQLSGSIAVYRIAVADCSMCTSTLTAGKRWEGRKISMLICWRKSVHGAAHEKCCSETNLWAGLHC